MDGALSDADGNVLGKVVERGPVFSIEGNKEMIGRVDAHGRVVDINGNMIGMVDGNGDVVDKNNKFIARVVAPDTIKFINNNGEWQGGLTSDHEVVDNNFKKLGKYDVEKNKFFGKNGEEFDPTKIYLYDLEDNIIAQLIGCDLFTPDGQTKLGSILSDGTIRDINNDLYGRAAPDNKVYNPDGTLKGEFRGAVDLRKCGLAGVGSGGSGRTISLPGMPLLKVESNGEIVDPRTNRQVGYIGDNGRPYLFNPPASGGAGADDTRPLPQPKPPKAVPEDWITEHGANVSNRRRSLAEKLSSGGTLKIPGPEILAKAKKHQDADWGIDKAVSTWPVDMSNMILKDKGIPAVLVHSIDTRYSDVPVTAYVERHIYAEAGRNIIIPAGSRLIGTASGASSAGAAKASKVTISWERLIRPDGAAFNFSATSADAQGRGGVSAYLDEQLFQKYANPFVTTIFTAVTNKLIDLNDGDKNKGSSDSTQATSEGQTYAQQTRRMFIDNFKDIFDTMLSEANSVQPVLFVPSGTRLVAYPSQDLWLRSVKDDEEQMTKEGLGNPSEAQKPDVSSWVDKRVGTEGEGESGGNSASAADEQVYAPDSASVDPSSPQIYDESVDALPDELLERSMDPVVQGGVNQQAAMRQIKNRI